MHSEYRLTPRMAQFAREYVATGNAAASVRNSGYSASGATAQGVRLLAKDSVQREVERLRQLQEQSAAVDRTYVVHKLREIAESGERESNRVRALELLGKSLRMFVEPVEVQHSVDTTVLQEFTEADLRAMLATQEPVVEAEARVLEG